MGTFHPRYSINPTGFPVHNRDALIVAWANGAKRYSEFVKCLVVEPVICSILSHYMTAQNSCQEATRKASIILRDTTIYLIVITIINHTFQTCYFACNSA